MRCAFDFTQHAFSGCDQFSAYTPTQRHEAVKHAIATVLRNYGFLAVVEPKFYQYADGVAHRPDITVFASMFPQQRAIRPIATDIVISAQSGAVGEAASSAAAVKVRHHTQAVNDFDHEFIPVSIEPHGHLHEAVTTFISKLVTNFFVFCSPTFAPSSMWSVRRMPGSSSLKLCCSRDIGSSYTRNKKLQSFEPVYTWAGGSV